MKNSISIPSVVPELSSLPFRLICFNLGKADAFLITTPHSAVLIDTGPDQYGKQLTHALLALGVLHLDKLIITHFHSDHIGGFRYLPRKISVGQVLQCPVLPDTSEARQYRSVLKKHQLLPENISLARQFTLDGTEYSILPPWKTHYSRNEQNNTSLIVTLRYGSCTFLFTGDAREERLGEYLYTNPGHCDVLKVPHHGHWQQALPALIQTVTPRFALITSSNGKKESPETLSLLKNASCRIFLTRKGTVACFSDGKTLSFAQ